MIAYRHISIRTTPYYDHSVLIEWGSPVEIYYTELSSKYPPTDTTICRYTTRKILLSVRYRGRTRGAYWG